MCWPRHWSLGRSAHRRRVACRFDPMTVRKGRRGRHRHPYWQCSGAATKSAPRSRRGAWVVYGGIHATLFPDEVHAMGSAPRSSRATAIWSGRASSALPRRPAETRVRRRARVRVTTSFPARWDLLPDVGYMWASVQTVRGCPKHCSFCSVWRTDGQESRPRTVDAVVGEIVSCGAKGSVHRAGRRQFLSRAVCRSGRRGPPRRQDALQRAEGNPPSVSS